MRNVGILEYLECGIEQFGIRNTGMQEGSRGGAQLELNHRAPPGLQAQSALTGHFWTI